MKWIISIFVVGAAYVGFYFINNNRNNVCKTFEDYYSDRDSNPNCYYNPDADLKAPEIIRRWGYPVEEHHATTKDGYIVTLFRIPHGKNSADSKPGQPVYLSHGYGTSSVGYLNTGKKSIAFILADAGYDVWLGNFRGTAYSRNHTHLSDTDSKFWDFGMDELGTYDTPANVDFIFGVTKQKIVYIGMSMGTITGYMYGTTFPDVAKEKVKVIISFAPAVFLKGGTLLPRHLYWLWPYVEPLIQWITNGELNLRSPNHFLRKTLCLPFPFQMKMCHLLDMISWGFDYEQSDPETLPVTIIQTADTCSIRVITHIVQFSTKGDFALFDFGNELNRKRYGSEDPPHYNLSNFKVPTYLIRGRNDYIVSKQDVDRLYSHLPEEAKTHGIHVVDYDKFNHGDFLIAKHVKTLLYDHIVKFLQKL